MAKQKREIVSTDDMHGLLDKKFPSPAYAVLHEVRNSTGFRKKIRTADALAMSLWPSRGIELIGFEIKMSRGDLKRELDDPEKASEIMKYCNRWWLVVGHKDLIQPGELPPTWGLMVAHKNTISSVVAAPELKPAPLDKLFVASILRNITEMYVPASQLDRMVSKERSLIAKNAAIEKEQSEKTLRGRVKDLEEIIQDFEIASGVSLHNKWDIGNIGSAIRTLKGGSAKDLIMVKNIAQEIVDRAEQGIGVLSNLEGKNDSCN